MTEAFNPARPRYALPLAGKEYELEGSFALIEAVEYALKDSILSVAVRVIEMPVTETAKLITAMLGACGHKTSAQEVGRILVDELGISSKEYAALKLHLYAFLSICITPPADREAKAKEMGELIGKWTSPAASRGRNTKSSASDTSDGHPKRSGRATSGR